MSTKNMYIIRILIYTFFIWNSTNVYAQCNVNVNEVTDKYTEDIEEIIPRVLWNEARGFHAQEEFMRAHATVVRTKILRNRIEGKTDLAEMASTIEPDYSSTAYANIVAAVTITKTKAIIYDGEIINAFFFARCNGVATKPNTDGIFAECGTCTSCFNGNEPYLVSVPCNLHTGCGSSTPGCCTNLSFFGHGVGMCQTGGNAYSEDGKSSFWIIDHFYPGTCVTLPSPAIPAFTCRGCVTDLRPLCNALNVSSTATSITVSQLSVEELGAAGASNFSIGYYLSATDDLNNSTLIGSQSVGHVGGNKILNLPAVTFDMPSVAGNYYYLIVVVDGSNSNADVDVSNNVCYGNGPIYVGGTPSCNDGIQNQGEFGVDCGGPCPACSPQINLTSQECAAPILNGNELNVFYNITNFGSSPSGTFWVGYFAYKSGDSNPYPLNIDTQHASIAGNTSQNLLKSIDLPSVMSAAGLIDGDYRIGIYIDINTNITESNENDNFCLGDIYFNYSSLNLTHATTCMTIEVAGENLNVYFDMLNTGNVNSGIVEYQLFIWDDLLNQYFTMGTTSGVTNIPANGSITVPVSFHLETEMAAHGLPVGLYELGVYIDYTSLVDETIETDNFCLNTISFNYTGGCNIGNSDLESVWDGTHELSAPDYFIAPNTGNQCIVPAPNGDLSLQAGGFIDLQPGFVAEYGSHFLAQIGDCDDVMNNLLAESSQNELITNTKSRYGEDNNQRIERLTERKQSPNIELDTDPVTLDFSVSPNPFSEITRISYNLSQEESLTLRIADTGGKTIHVLKENEHFSSGSHFVELNSKHLQSGTYILILSTASYSVSKKIFLIK